MKDEVAKKAYRKLLTNKHVRGLTEEEVFDLECKVAECPWFSQKYGKEKPKFILGIVAIVLDSDESSSFWLSYNQDLVIKRVEVSEEEARRYKIFANLVGRDFYL